MFRAIGWLVVAMLIAAAGCDVGGSAGVPPKPADAQTSPPAAGPESARAAPLPVVAPPSQGGAASATDTRPAPPAPAPKNPRLDDPAAGPRLQDGPPKTSVSAGRKGPRADNSRCHVCHMNYEDEQLSVVHALAEIGCQKCHGPSDEHCGDEGNVTPPTIFYTKAEVDKSCRKCHPEPEDGIIVGAKVCLHLLTEAERGKRCTDCHGRHRMAVRSVRWDPVTRKAVAATKDAS